MQQSVGEISNNDAFDDDNYAGEYHNDDHVDNQNSKLFGVLKIDEQQIPVVATVIYILSMQLVHFLCSALYADLKFFYFYFSLLHLLNLISVCHFCYEDCQGFKEGQYLQALPRTIKNVDFKEYSPQEHHYNVSWVPVKKHIIEGMY